MSWDPAFLRRFGALLLAAITTGLPIHGFSQSKYPTQPITLIVPWPAGAGTDVVQRAAAKLVEADLGQPIVVVNKPGAAGIIGGKLVEDSTADGYTLGGIASTVVLTQYTSPNPTDWSKYAPIAHLTYDPAAIAVKAESKWRSLADVIRYARANPGKLTVANSGTGGMHHIFAVMLEQAAGVEFRHIPYKGGTGVVTGVLGDQVDLGSADSSAFYAQVKSGKLRLLGLAGDARHPEFQDVATYQEQGVDLSIGVRRLVVAPAGTAPSIVKILEHAYLKAIRDPRFTKLRGGWQIVGLSAEETAKVMLQDDRMLKRIVERAGLNVGAK